MFYVLINESFSSFCLLQIKRYEKLETIEERRKLAREIYDNFIMKELLSHTHVILGRHFRHVSLSLKSL